MALRAAGHYVEKDYWLQEPHGFRAMASAEVTSVTPRLQRAAGLKPAGHGEELRRAPVLAVGASTEQYVRVTAVVRLAARSAAPVTRRPTSTASVVDRQRRCVPIDNPAGPAR